MTSPLFSVIAALLVKHRKTDLFAKAPLGRGNNDDRRQWRKQGVVVGAAASKTRAMRSGCWVPQPGLVER